MCLVIWGSVVFYSYQAGVSMVIGRCFVSVWGNPFEGHVVCGGFLYFDELYDIWKGGGGGVFWIGCEVECCGWVV